MPRDSRAATRRSDWVVFPERSQPSSRMKAPRDEDMKDEEVSARVVPVELFVAVTIGSEPLTRGRVIKEEGNEGGKKERGT